MKLHRADYFHIKHIQLFYSKAKELKNYNMLFDLTSFDCIINWGEEGYSIHVVLFNLISDDCLDHDFLPKWNIQHYKQKISYCSQCFFASYITGSTPYWHYLIFYYYFLNKKNNSWLFVRNNELISKSFPIPVILI